MPELIQAVLVAMLMIIVPASARFATKAVSKKLDEGRSHADARANEQQKKADDRHKDNTARLDRIEAQTTATNGKVAEHDKLLTILSTKQEVLMEIYLKGKAE